MGKRIWGVGEDLGLEVGDKAFAGSTVVTITRKTPTLYIVGDGKYASRWYHDGSTVGDNWLTQPRLSHYSRETEQEIEAMERRRRLRNDVYYFERWKRLSEDELMLVHEIIAPYLRRR